MSNVILDDALRSMRRWNTFIKNGEDRVAEMFSNYNGFIIDAKDSSFFADDCPHHVYMGMTPDEVPEYFIIPDFKDNPSGIQIPGAILRCEAKEAANQHDELPPEEASRRKSNWVNNYRSWVKSMYSMEYPIFHAWHVPMPDTAGNNVHHFVSFGLIVSEEQNRTDLIFYVPGNDGGHFFDLVRPVPPFKSGELADYTLLMKALSIEE